MIVTEAVDTDTLELVCEYADIIQIGARNMQNYSLLKKAGRTNKPVLIKRGMSASLDEFLMAAEYVMVEGNPRVILCERGVRTFSNHNRNVLDLSAVTYVKKFSHLPIIADPSHGSGQKYKVVPLSRASLAAGADGLLVEVHHEPEKALSDGPQAITLTDFDDLMSDVKKIAAAIGRTCK
jgi:3-deoxy-7-phosphoheptulonate synthase